MNIHSSVNSSRLVRPLILLAGLWALGLGGAALTGCATTAKPKDEPVALMKEAEEDIKSDHYLIAIDKLREIKSRFPYSKYAALAQLRIGDVFFLQESYGEASAAYEAFRDLHPKHEKVEYALRRIGESYYKDVPDNVALDMGSLNRAIESMEEYIRRFPKGEYAAEARKVISELRNKLATKELYIAEFYLKRDQKNAAAGRLAKIERLYPEVETAKKARELLAKLKPGLEAGAVEESTEGMTE